MREGIVKRDSIPFITYIFEVGMCCGNGYTVSSKVLRMK
jgi:hypothetical protein